VVSADVRVDLGPLEELASGKALRRALKIGINRAARPVKAAVKSEASSIQRYGYLAKSIRIKAIVYESGNAVAVIGPTRKYQGRKGKFTRGPRKGESRVFIPANYAHLVEKGTAHARPHPFLKPALNSTLTQYLEAVKDEIRKEVERVSSRKA